MKRILFLLPFLMIVSCAEQEEEEATKNILGSYAGKTDKKLDCEVSFYEDGNDIEFKLTEKEKGSTSKPVTYSARFETDKFETYLNDLKLNPKKPLEKPGSGGYGGTKLELDIQHEGLRNVRHWVVYKKEPDYHPCLLLKKD